MIKRLKNITSLLLVLVLFVPSIIKLIHHHEHFVFKDKNEKHYYKLHEKCEVCLFNFSIFSSETINIDFKKEQVLDNYCNHYVFKCFASLSQFSFLLRAPPI